MKVELQSTITFPACGHQATETKCKASVSISTFHNPSRWSAEFDPNPGCE
jgi:hypothetical protein